LDAAASGAGHFCAAVPDRALVFLKGKRSGRCRHHKITATTAICLIGEIVSRIRVAVKSSTVPKSIARPGTYALILGSVLDCGHWNNGHYKSLPAHSASRPPRTSQAFPPRCPQADPQPAAQQLL